MRILIRSLIVAPHLPALHRPRTAVYATTQSGLTVMEAWSTFRKNSRFQPAYLACFDASLGLDCANEIEHEAFDDHHVFGPHGRSSIGCIRHRTASACFNPPMID